MTKLLRAGVLSVVCSVLFTASAAWAAPIELIINGGFETGTFAGWIEADQPGGTGSWFVNSGTVSPVSGFGTVGPASGTFYAVTDQGGPGAHVLLQSFTVPVGATSVTLTFDMFSDNQNGTKFCPGPLDFTVVPNQCARVDILSAGATLFDTGAGVIQNLYEDASPGGPNPYVAYTFGLTGLGPGTFQLRFGEVDNQFFFQQGVDDVSITASLATVPEPASLLLLGSGLLGLVGIVRRKLLS